MRPKIRCGQDAGGTTLAQSAEIWSFHGNQLIQVTEVAGAKGAEKMPPAFEKSMVMFAIGEYLKNLS